MVTPIRSPSRSPTCCPRASARTARSPKNLLLNCPHTSSRNRRTLTANISTTPSGAPVTSAAHAQSVGADGAIILTDHYLIEKLAQFNRERVPERVVHAKGGGAFGPFKATPDLSKYTQAAFLQPGV